MSHTLKSLLALALVAGFASAPTASWAESGAKDGAKKSQSAGVDEFEENRKAHMQKSKENNDKKGAN